MRRTTLALVLAFAPGYLVAQGQDAGQAQSQPASQSQATSGFSAETRVRLEAMLRIARERDLPTGPLTSVMAEGQAKGASEARILAATQRAEAALAASQQALIRAGHSQPSDAQVESGAQVIARGASSAQLEALARQASSEHRLEVAFQVLTDLAARGIPVGQALTVVGANLTGADNAQSGSSATANPANQPHGIGVSNAVTGQLGIGLVRKP